jgi:hypothetical protein
VLSLSSILTTRDFPPAGSISSTSNMIGQPSSTSFTAKRSTTSCGAVTWTTGRRGDVSRYGSGLIPGIAIK